MNHENNKVLFPIHSNRSFQVVCKSGESYTIYPFDHCDCVPAFFFPPFIYGRVTDEDGNGIGNVQVLVGGVELTRTANDGTYRAQLQNRMNRLVVR